MNPRINAHTQIDSPLGRITLARTPAGLAGLWFEGQKHAPLAMPAPRVDDDELLLEAQRQLHDYWRGERRVFELPLDAHGTTFQQAVWQSLREIPSGQTTSYAALARSIGAALAMRAVGAAVGRNPLSVIVPCHRVVGSDGSMTGYAGGLERKTALLRLEGMRTATAVAA
jgi:methylated-DNA-[protein]-cysteine S-methyltransferase